MKEQQTYLYRLYLESSTSLLQPLTQKPNVYFALDIDMKEHSKTLPLQRNISPLPINNATKYKSDSNPNLLMTTVTAAPAVHTSLVGHHVLTVNIFNKEILKDLFYLAELFRNAIRKERSLDHILKVIHLNLYKIVYVCYTKSRSHNKHRNVNVNNLKFV